MVIFFKYSDKAKKYALSNINLSIKSGETVGLIGGTGSSKSSLIQLISRLYDTTEGEVLVAGVNVKDYDLNSLRSSVAVVLQKNLLFSAFFVCLINFCHSYPRKGIKIFFFRIKNTSFMSNFDL